MVENKQVTNENENILCYYIYRFFAYVGNKLYILSEKCVLFSKDREKKLQLDEEYDNKIKVGSLILSNEKITQNIQDNVDISCSDTVKELGKNYSSIEGQLGVCREVVEELWEAYKEKDTVRMNTIFNSIGLKNEVL